MIRNTKKSSQKKIKADWQEIEMRLIQLQKSYIPHVTSVDQIFRSYQNVLNEVVVFNLNHNADEKIPDKFTTKICSHMKYFVLNENEAGDMYLFELSKDLDFTEPGMQVLLIALINSISIREKPVSLNLSKYFFSQLNPCFFDIILSTLKKNLRTWNISEMWLSGYISPNQLQTLMQLIGGSNIQSLHLNSLLSVNYQHIRMLAAGLTKDLPCLNKITLENWEKTVEEVDPKFSVELRYFLDKLALHCNRPFILSFTSNFFIDAGDNNIKSALNHFMTKRKDCSIFAPQIYGFIKKTNARLSTYAVISDFSRESFLTKTAITAKKETTCSIKISGAADYEVSFQLFNQELLKLSKTRSSLKIIDDCYTHQPWVKQQIEFDKQRLIEIRWLQENKPKIRIRRKPAEASEIRYQALAVVHEDSSSVAASAKLVKKSTLSGESLSNTIIQTAAVKQKAYAATDVDLTPKLHMETFATASSIDKQINLSESTCLIYVKRMFKKHLEDDKKVLPELSLGFFMSAKIKQIHSISLDECLKDALQSHRSSNRMWRVFSELGWIDSMGRICEKAPRCIKLLDQNIELSTSCVSAKSSLVS